MKNKTEHQLKVRFSCLLTLLVLSLLSFSSAAVHAEELAAVEVPIMNKSITGQVGASTAQGFALVYKAETETEYEMWFPLEKGTQFIGGYKGAGDMEYGDKVMVSYGEAADGTKKILQSVNLIKKGEPIVAADPEPESEELEEGAEESI